MYNVVYSTLCSMYMYVHYMYVHYSISYTLQKAGKGLFLRELVCLPSHFDVWLQFIVQYSVQCTLYSSFKIMYVGHTGTRWDVTLQAVNTILKFHCQNKRYVKH